MSALITEWYFIEPELDEEETAFYNTIKMICTIPTIVRTPKYVFFFNRVRHNPILNFKTFFNFLTMKIRARRFIQK